MGFSQAETNNCDDEEEGTGLDPACEAKYLFHLRTFHGLDR
jgi:hypothetical protein